MRPIICSILFFFVFSLQVNAKSQSYLEAADVFELMDQVSMWNSSIDPVLRNYWIKKFGAKSLDTASMNNYIALRKKYHKGPPKEESFVDLFSSGEKILLRPYTFFEEAFYSVKGVDKAIKKLKRKLKPEELNVLKDFYKTYQDQIRQIVSESSLFNSLFPRFMKDFKKKKGMKVISSAMKFLWPKGIKKKTKGGIKLIPLWYPKEKKPQVTIVGPYVLLKAHPSLFEAAFPMEQVLQKIVARLAHYLPAATRRIYSEVFLEKCKLPRNLNLEILFLRPLSLALGKINHRQLVGKKTFSYEVEMSLHPWENVYGKLLYSLYVIESKKRLNMTPSFVEKAAGVCQQLLKLHSFLGS
jgi:hypothetical protein